MDAELWRALFQADPAGRIWYANLAFDLQCGNIEQRLWDEFLTLAESMAVGWIGFPTFPLNFVDWVLRSSHRQFCFRGKRTTIAGDWAWLIDALSFSIYNIDPMMELDERTDEKVWNQLGISILPKHYCGQIKTMFNFFWASPSVKIDELSSKCPPDSFASELRDILGLAHYGADTLLLRVELPESVLTGKCARVPTTLDSGPSIHFLSHDGKADTGFTVHLETLTVGFEEVLIEPVPLTSDFLITRVGCISRQAPTFDYLASTNLREDRLHR